MRRLLIPGALALLLSGCDIVSLSTKELPANPLSEAKANLAFSCVHESMPESSADSDVLFQYARWLQKNNQLKKDRTIDLQIERLYRISVENDHFKANINLQNGSMRGHYRLIGEEYLRLSQNLINAGVATGYYFVGIFLKKGAAGLGRDEEMALRYFRKAADTGSAQAQYLVAEKLAPIGMAPDVARKMRRCAAEQGHGEAAVELAIDLKSDGLYEEALEAFQLGVKAGVSVSASFMYKSFLSPSPSNRLHYLNQQEDLARSERYEKIWRILANYSYANPKVPEINEILPLPPAPLPEWDGKLQWLEDRLANIPPEKPSEALIEKLAKEKGLDPATGKPMPGSPSFSQAKFPLRISYSHSVCPETGYWKVIWNAERRICRHEVIKHIKEGEVFPKAMVERFHLRPWPLSDKKAWREETLKWGLLG